MEVIVLNASLPIESVTMMLTSMPDVAGVKLPLMATSAPGA